MKVALSCESTLLQKSLAIFLKPMLSPEDTCDFIISDKKVKSKKPILYLGKRKDASLDIPFSKAELLSTLEQFYQKHSSEDAVALERAVEKLNKKHKEKIERILKAFDDESL